MNSSRAFTFHGVANAFIKATLATGGLWIAGMIILGEGCTPSRPAQLQNVFQVRGVVTYQGKPVAGAQLTFHRDFDDEREGAFALTDARGKFTGSTNDATGILPGDYRVTVTVAHTRLKLPAKYADVEESPLKLTVSGDLPEQEFPVHLID